jgi:hypothetical protein
LHLGERYRPAHVNVACTYRHHNDHRSTNHHPACDHVHRTSATIDLDLEYDNDDADR